MVSLKSHAAKLVFISPVSEFLGRQRHAPTMCSLDHLKAAMSDCESLLMQCAHLAEVQMCAAYVLNADTLMMLLWEFNASFCGKYWHYISCFAVSIGVMVDLGFVCQPCSCMTSGVVSTIHSPCVPGLLFEPATKEALDRIAQVSESINWPSQTNHLCAFLGHHNVNLCSSTHQGPACLGEALGKESHSFQPLTGFSCQKSQ